MAQIITARLARIDSQPWGFRLQGGKDFGTPLVIQKVSDYHKWWPLMWNCIGILVDFFFWLDVWFGPYYDKLRPLKIEQKVEQSRGPIIALEFASISKFDEFKVKKLKYFQYRYL